MSSSPLGRTIAALTAVVAALALAVPAAATPTGSPHSTGRSSDAHYYLALGDSISYGFQTAKALAGLPPSAFDTGYVDRVSAGLPRVLHLRRPITTVNLSCPGETTTTLRTLCGWRASGHLLHDDYRGAQLDAARAFLHRHRGRVDLITLALGGNDVTEFVASCPPGDVACLKAGAPRAATDYAARMAVLLRQLRAAAPNTRVVVVGLYDPDITLLPVADPLFALVNDALRSAITTPRVGFADTFARFNPPTGEVATLCTLTLLCVDNDGHPSDAGYAAMGDIVLASVPPPHTHRLGRAG
jgi:lysophospholipase L1-like esterase